MCFSFLKLRDGYSCPMPQWPECIFSTWLTAKTWLMSARSLNELYLLDWHSHWADEMGVSITDCTLCTARPITADHQSTTNYCLLPTIKRWIFHADGDDMQSVDARQVYQPQSLDAWQVYHGTNHRAPECCVVQHITRCDPLLRPTITATCCPGWSDWSSINAL